MAHDGGGPRRRRDGRLGVEHDAVDRLQHQALGFGGHGADGTVAAVPEADPKLPIKMLNDRLLVKIPHEDGERKSTGGILIPATAQVAKRLVWAEVMGVGQNVRTVQVGDQVLFSPEDRYEVEVRGDDYLILRERDIHAVAAERVEGSTGLYL
jgi:chaperonin GroES